MNILQSYPIIKLLGAFLLGILFFFWIPTNIPSHTLLLTLSSLTLLTTIHIFYRRLFKNPTSEWFFGAILLFSFSILGYTIANSNTKPIFQNNLLKHQSDSTIFIARVIEAPQEKLNTYKIILSLENNFEGDSAKICDELCIAYIAKDSLVHTLKYGDNILFKSTISEVKAPSNPHQFNYKKYLASKKIYHQTYVPSGDWQFIGKGKSNPIFDYSYKIRDYLVKNLHNNGLEGDEFAVATALILGYDDKISYELSAKYSHAGAMHILCVSGLHVGIIFLIVSNLLQPLSRFKNGKILKLVLVLLIIWLFAAITGLSSSVMRAATMFSFVALGTILKRKNSIYNTLALSAFLLLIIKPSLIFDLGFQLSYSAVIGIVAIQPSIYKIWKTKNWFLDKIWAITTVSISAQIATLPLALFYFHQFPNYFILSNLIVIPLATIIIYLGIVVILFTPIKFISAILAKLLSATIYSLNYSVSFIDSLPFSYTEGIVINQSQAILLTTAIVTFYWFFKRNNKKLMYAGLFLLLLFFSVSSSRILLNRTKTKIVVYDTRNSTAIDFIDNSKALLIADSTLDEKAISFNIRNNRWYSDINASKRISELQENFISEKFGLMKYGHFIKFKDKTIALISNLNNKLYSKTPIKVDFLIVTGNPKELEEEVLLSYTCKKIIFDSSNSKWNVEKWISICEKQNILYHSVPHNGAFVEEL